MGSKALPRGPLEGQHRAPFCLVDTLEGKEPFELTPEQEEQIKDGATQVKPRRQLMRWYFEKTGVSSQVLDAVWINATSTYWFILLNQGHTRVSRDSMLAAIDSKVWDVIAKALFSGSPLFPEYPFQERFIHDESAPMSQEFDKLRERLRVPLLPDGSRTHDASARPGDGALELSDVELGDFLKENDLYGIISVDAANKYSTPLAPAQKPKTFAVAAARGASKTETAKPVTIKHGAGEKEFTLDMRSRTRKDCSQQVRKIWEDQDLTWAKCPSMLFPGPFQVTVPHVPELFKLNQGQEIIRCFSQDSRVILRRYYYSEVDLDNSNKPLVHRYVIGPDLEGEDGEAIDLQIVYDILFVWQLSLNWALTIWSGTMIGFEEWMEIYKENVYLPMKEPALTMNSYAELLAVFHKYRIDSLGGLVQRTNSIRHFLETNDKTRRGLAAEVAIIQQDKNRRYLDRVDQMAELALRYDRNPVKLGTKSRYEGHLLNVLWVISRSGAEASNSANRENMWPTVGKVSQAICERTFARWDQQMSRGSSQERSTSAAILASVATSNEAGILDGLQIWPILRKANGTLSQWQCLLLLVRHVLVIRAHQVGPSHPSLKFINQNDGEDESFLSLIHISREEVKNPCDIYDEAVRSRLELETGTLLDAMQGQVMSDIFWSRPEFKLSRKILLQSGTSEENKNGNIDMIELLKEVNRVIIRWDPLHDSPLHEHIPQELLNRCRHIDGTLLPAFNRPCMMFICVDTAENTSVPYETHIPGGAISMYEGAYFQDFNTQPYYLICKVDMLTDNTYNMASYEPGMGWSMSEGKHMQDTGNHVRKGKSLLVYSQLPAASIEQPDHTIRSQDTESQRRLQKIYDDMLMAGEASQVDWQESMTRQPREEFEEQGPSLKRPFPQEESLQESQKKPFVGEVRPQSKTDRSRFDMGHGQGSRRRRGRNERHTRGS